MKFKIVKNIQQRHFITFINELFTGMNTLGDISITFDEMIRKCMESKDS